MGELLLAFADSDDEQISSGSRNGLNLTNADTVDEAHLLLGDRTNTAPAPARADGPRKVQSRSPGNPTTSAHSNDVDNFGNSGVQQSLNEEAAPTDDGLAGARRPTREVRIWGVIPAGFGGRATDRNSLHRNLEVLADARCGESFGPSSSGFNRDRVLFAFGLDRTRVSLFMTPRQQ